MGNLLTMQIINFPNIKGKIFVFQLGKTLRDGSTNAFGILPDKLYPVMCPIRRLDKFLKFCETHNLAMEGNRIFTKLNVNKTSINDNNPSRCLTKMSTEDMTNRLKFHMAKAGMEPSTGGLTFSMHSFRSGGPTSMRPSLTNNHQSTLETPRNSYALHQITKRTGTIHPRPLVHVPCRL